MALFIYADESGVFDHVHNAHFTFGGVILLDKMQRDKEARKWLHAERQLGAAATRTAGGELKACVLSNKHKGSLFRSLGGIEKFAVVVDQRRIKRSIYGHKKSKQRYLDYAFKIGLKHALERLILEGTLDKDYSGTLEVRMDEHTTATNGRYELKEALEAEFRDGTHNYEWNRYFPPILPNLNEVRFAMRDSVSDPLIRAADIVANRAYHHARTESLDKLRGKIHTRRLP